MKGVCIKCCERVHLDLCADCAEILRDMAIAKGKEEAFLSAAREAHRRRKGDFGSQWENLDGMRDWCETMANLAQKEATGG